MADSLKSLSQKYNGFLRPIMAIKINGKEADDDYYIYRNLDVVISSGYEASVCTFDVIIKNSRYIDKSIKISADFEKDFSIGSKIELLLGYGSKKNCSPVFVGYITSINFEMSNENVLLLSIEAMDFKVFMMSNKRSELRKGVKRYSEAVSSVLQDYSKFFDGKVVSATPEVSCFIEQHNQSDYEFIVDLAKRVNYLFFVSVGRVSFVDYASIKETTVLMEPGPYLFSFNREVSLSRQVKSVTVRSNDEQDPTKPIEGIATKSVSIGDGKKSGHELTRLINDGMDVTIIDHSIKSQKEAKVRAEAELTKLSLGLVMGEIETIGLPEVLPGKYVKVDKVHNSVNGKYFVNQVRHIINDDGYKTICRYGVNRV